MIGEREDILNENQYGALTMRPYVIDGNEINAFYDDSDDLVFVLDNTINQRKPNVLLVINPSGDKKWDEILSGQYDVDLETIRPKQDNKYQKLDIEYSGLSVYENLINAYVSGDDLSEHLVQLNILRDSAVRHSAMARLNAANDAISKTNVTIVKTKESIVRLQNRLKTLRAKLSSTKKEIGKVSTKQSAAKILKLESQIEATNEKIKQAQKRLDSAQKRLEIATVDAELASELLNQPALDIEQQPVKSKSVIVAPKHEIQTVSDDEPMDEDKDDDEDFDSDITDDNEDDIEDDIDEYDDKDDEEDEVKPLFDENPNNMNEDIAFKPISFDTPVMPALNMDNNDNIKTEPVFNPQPIFNVSEPTENETENFVAPDISNIVEQKPVLESMMPVVDNDESKPVLESMTPIQNFEPEQNQMTPAQPIDVQPVVEQKQPEIVRPVSPISPVPPVAPVAPIMENNISITETQNRSKPTLIYYLLLIILIGLSVFTLWLYQKKMGNNAKPDLIATVSETQVVEQQQTSEPAITESQVDSTENVEQATVAQQPTEYEFADGETEQPTEEIYTETPGVATETVNNNIVKSETVVNQDSVDVPQESEQSDEPVIINVVPARVMTSGDTVEEEVIDNNLENQINKPEYEAGSRHEKMFVSEQDYQATSYDDSDMDDEYFYED